MLIAFIRKPKILKTFVKLILFTIVFEVLAPSAAYALTSGPSQPEFSSFEPISSSNMVNEFTGDFTYNLPVLEVPGPHGSGYPLSLSYHSGVSPEEEASWVGYGWTLNPGAINRNTRGLPDDYKNTTIKYHSRMPTNTTITAGLSGSLEVFSADGISVNTGIRYNNYRGFAKTAGLGIPLGKGFISLGLNLSTDQDATFSPTINPMVMVTRFIARNQLKVDQKLRTNLNSKERAKQERKLATLNKVANLSNLIKPSYGLSTYAYDTKPIAIQKMLGLKVNLSLGFQTSPSGLPIGQQGRILGSYSGQYPDRERNIETYGFLYTGNADKSKIMDYYVEKENSYDKQDVYLGIPFNNADNFMVTGEGIAGGFRVHHKQIGEFGPNEITSHTIITNVGMELDAGGNFGSGVDLGLGDQEMTEEAWVRDYRFSTLDTDDKETIDEPIFFKFTNDLAGEWDLDGNDDPIKVYLDHSGSIGSPTSSPVYTPRVSDLLTEGKIKMKQRGDINKRNSRSTYISFGINKEMLASGSTPFSAKAINRRTDIRNIQNDKTSQDVSDRIGEFAIHNPNGERYVYGLPVYSRNEKNLQYYPKNFPKNLANDNDRNHLIYGSNNVDKDKVRIGEERPSAYPTTYLLTEITTPDYIDKGFDGPDAKDYGGYTAFNYDKKYGGGVGSWYQWRAPYSGFMFERNSLSDRKDDRASFSSGEKEIYYLQSIETKSHVAIFTTDERTDGYSAALGESAEQKNAQGSQKLSYLKRIDLYTINQVEQVEIGGVKKWKPKIINNVQEKPIKTVRFKYADANNSLAKGAPNTSSNNTGKLTLEKVWFEYNGIEETQISPYTFQYQYPNFNDYPTKYRAGGVDDVTKNSEGKSFSGLLENPNYSAFDTDAWGNYEMDVYGQNKSRKEEMKDWINQNPSNDFDPAAWHLKVIKLPSGGQIHIQYEQNDYMYVQDELAHAMVSLKNTSINGDSNAFTLNLDELGITDINDKRKLKELIQKIYVEDRDLGPFTKPDRTKNKMYFKFLYNLITDNLINPNTPEISDQNADYIDGYIKINSVNLNEGSGELSIITTNNAENSIQGLCKNFVKFERFGMISVNPSDTPGHKLDGVVNVLEGIKELTNVIFLNSNVVSCKTYNPGLSYFRVPMVKKKKGGGVRVKRLLTFDNTLIQPVLYGSEYIYEVYDRDINRVVSSGVATNEPTSIREENILTKSIQRKSKPFVQELMGGKDREKSEGPIGESIMPGPSVGYSRVIVKNIHSGKSNAGFSESLYYTAKDYPVIVKMSNLQTPKPYYRNINLPPFYINMANNLWATQSFSFIFNNMHGQVKQKTSYAGVYSNDLSKASVIARQTYEYFQPGEKIRMADSKELALSDISDIDYPKYQPGREVDVTLASKAVKENMVDGNKEVDFTVGFFGIAAIPFFGFMPTITKTQTEYRTYATSKIVRYPSILKKTVTYQDGIEHTSENLVFDKNTGQPIVVKSYDEFKGAYQSYQTMASWEYKGMGSKALNEGKIIKSSQNLTFSIENQNNKLYLELGQSKACEYMLEFMEGDLVNLGEANSNKLYNLGEADLVNNRFRLYKSSMPGSNALSGNEVINRIEVIRSGRTHQLSATVGGTTYHDKEAKFVGLSINSRNVASPFTDDLKAKMLEFGSVEGSFTLPASEYTGMNISAYNIGNSCVTNQEDAKIRQVKMAYRKYNNGEIELQIISFEVYCTNTATWLKID